MGQLYHFLDVRKSLERQASKKFYNKYSENSRSQIVFRTDIFRKLSLGAPEIYIIAIKCANFSTFCAISCDSLAHFLQQRRGKDGLPRRRF